MRIARGRTEESGAALVFALFVGIVALGVTLSGTLTLRANKVRTETHHLVNGPVTQVAYSGLTETLNWLRRQDRQPVSVFEPKVDPTASPAILDTLEPDVGLVREFQIRGDLWGRYEIWRQWDGDPDARRLGLRQQVQAVDISALSPRAPGASTWLVKSMGFVFQRTDPNLAFDTAPNRVLGTSTLEAEFSRAVLLLPGLAAISGRMGGPLIVHPFGAVHGGLEATGIYYLSKNGSPNIQGPLTGMPPLSPTSTYDDTPETLFGITEDALRTMADFLITDQADFPVPVPPLSIVFVDDAVSSLQFDAGRPLLGSGLLYIKGNLKIEDGSNSDFKGLLYNHGHVNMGHTSTITGAVVIKKGLNMGPIPKGWVGPPPPPALVRYSGAALAALAEKLANYRLSSAVRVSRN